MTTATPPPNCVGTGCLILNPNDKEVTGWMLWWLVIELAVLAPLLLAVTYTANKYFTTYMVFRTKGYWYMRFLTFGWLIQAVFSFTVALTCYVVRWNVLDIGFAVLRAFEQCWLFFLSGAIVGRQIQLATIFQTFRSQKLLSTNRMFHFLVYPAFQAFAWLLLGELSDDLYQYGIIPLSTASVLTYVFVAIFACIYLCYLLLNTRIRIKAFSDYFTNLFTFVLLIVIISVASSFVSSYFVPNNYLLAFRAFRSAVYVLMSMLFTLINLFRPVLAVWLHQKDYLEAFDEALKSVVMIDSLSKAGSTGPKVTSKNEEVISFNGVELEIKVASQDQGVGEAV